MAVQFIYPALSVSSAPIQYNLDGVPTTVSEDTAVPANSTPLPVKLMGTTGPINITAGDLNVQLSDQGANPDVTRIGDGTTQLSITALGEAKVFAASLPLPTGAATEATLATLATEATVATLATEATVATLATEATVATLATEATVSTLATETTLASIATNTAKLAISESTSLVDTSSTNIPASASLPLQVVASTAAITRKIQSVEDVGEFIGVYKGAAASETLVGVLPLGGGEIEVNLPAGTRISLRNMKNAAIASGFIVLNLLG